MQRILVLLLIVCTLAISCQSGSDSGPSDPQTEGQANTDPDQPTRTGPSIPLAFPTPYASAMPLPAPSAALTEVYVIQPGDTLGGISLAFDVPLAELIALNNLGSENAIIQIGQALQVPLSVSRSAPELTLMPDSEVVFSPAYAGFDVGAFVTQHGGYLAGFSAPVNGGWLSGVEIINRVARQYSVGPRVLLALLEFYGGWVTQAEPKSYQPLGPANPYYEETFFLQLSWAANRVNDGYYHYKKDGIFAVRFLDGGRALVPGGLNAATAAVQNILAVNSDWDSWQIERQGFMDTYRVLFGDPFAMAFEPLIPFDLTQPDLRLPWQPGVTFYFTGGPHAAYGIRCAWAAVDFAPPDIQGSCYYSQEDIVAAADGRLVLGERGEIYLDLDGDGNLQTGWVLLYLHTIARDDITHGQTVSAGTPLGFASCEGGYSTSSHLHLARRYNGEWMAAAGPVPMVLSGWQVHEDVGQYDGTMERDGVVKTACEVCDESMNALIGE